MKQNAAAAFLKSKGPAQAVFLWGVSVLLIAAMAVGARAAGAAVAPGVAPAAGAPLAVGFLHPEAAQYQANWQRHGYYLALAAAGLQGALVDDARLYNGAPQPGWLYAAARPFHAVVLSASGEAVGRLDEAGRARAAVARDDLVRYVQEGGGLFIEPHAVRYPGDGDEEFLNIILAPFEAATLHQGIFDPATAFTAPPVPSLQGRDDLQRFFSTRAIAPHPVTRGVRALALPEYGQEPPCPGVEALRLGSQWQVLVAAEPTAHAYPVGEDNGVELTQPLPAGGQLAIAAARQFGAGRVVLFSVPERSSLLNYGNPMWPQITESVGNAAAGVPSDGNTLIANALAWVGAPARANPQFGSFVPQPIEPIEVPAAVNWDSLPFVPERAGVRGIMGAHTSLSDGQGSVADYVTAARAAGLSFITFTEPLELMTAEKLEQLKAQCRAASDDSFVAVPGVEFTDSLGVRWATWGERVVWPETSFTSDGKTFPVWDGHRLTCRGRYEMMCGFSPNAIIDYGALHAANAHPANLWWFYRILPLSYEVDASGAHLLADNFEEYLYALRDLRYIAIDAFTRVRSPAQVALAAATCATSTASVAAARDSLGHRAADCGLFAGNLQYVTQGPRILRWQAINSQMENSWTATRGAQRVPVCFTVQSTAGIDEVIVHDANFGVLRRYLGHGAPTLARNFELVQDRQHYLVLEVKDRAGRRAFSPYLFVYCYKSGLYRCTDNLNTLGSAQLVWHPDRNQMPSLSKYFENGFAQTVQGIDSGAPVATSPELFAREGIQTSVGSFPAPGEIVNKIPDIVLGSTDLQIYRTAMEQVSESYDTATRPTPSMGAVARRLHPLHFYQQHQTTYAPAGRANYFVIWNHRRPFEGLANYRGTLLWHEGEIRFTQSVTLRGAVPLPLLQMRQPGGAGLGIGDHLFVTDAQAGKLALTTSPGQTVPLVRQGSIAAGGYCVAMNTDLGYYAFFAPPGSAFTYQTAPVAGHLDGVGNVVVGLGHDGEQVPAGTVWKYRYAVGTIASPVQSTALVEDTARAFDLDGGGPGYASSLQVGKKMGDEFFFDVSASGNEARFALGPRSTLMDLPIKVRGLADNGCAAVWGSGREFFRFVPVVDGCAWLQEPIETRRQLWVGNPFVCDRPTVKLTLVQDGQAAGRGARLEVHNPTDNPLRARISSPPHTPLYGGFSASVQVPAGDSVFVPLKPR